MENENSCNSLPYIDDTPTEDETNLHQYNLKIIENYHNQNRNIEITNQFSNNTLKSLSPVAPLADETEFSDNKLNDFLDEDTSKHLKNESEMKLIIKGWNSSISIQGLDNKSFITFKRRCEKMHKKVERNEERKSKLVSDEAKSTEKSRKGRWKMLTKSIMLTKSARFERKGLDERYPKYVLLKNEEDELAKDRENYPKMFIFNEKSAVQKKNSGTKTEFSLKKTFKNKTEPIKPLEEILAETKEAQAEKPRTNTREGIKKQKKPLTQRNLIKKKVTSERSLSSERKTDPPVQSEVISTFPFPHGQVCSEIQGIFEDTLKLLPQVQSEKSQQQSSKRAEYFSSVPSKLCQFPCRDPYCCVPPHDQPPNYTSAYATQKPFVYKTSNLQNQSCHNQEMSGEDQIASDVEVELENLPFGMLSSFFPRVVIMNTIRSNSLKSEEEIISSTNETEFENYKPKTEEVKDEKKDTESNAIECLEVSKQDPTLKTKMIQEIVKPNMEMKEFFLSKGLKEFSSLDEDQKPKSQGSEATEYLQYSEFDLPENESVEPPNPTTPPPLPQYDRNEKRDKSLPSVDKFTIEDVDESSENLSLTKIGYKMYDNLTKLSLNREKEMTKKAEVSGCGCNGNGTKKSPYNITLESNNSIVKVTVPENELNFQIVNSQGGDIQVGVMSGGKGMEEDKKIVRRKELWHCDDGGRALVLHNGKSRHLEGNEKAFQNFKISLANDKEVVLSIEMNENEKKQEEKKEKSTKEVKVGTDDFDLAGGDFVCSFGENYKNLSPRVGQLLKHLHKKLETDEKERKYLDEKINQTLIDQKIQGGILPGVFLVKHISPRTPVFKKPAEISSFRKQKKKTESQERGGQLREYYCEECLATMRIFEDENPSVKSMVDKFETIIQLESY